VGLALVVGYLVVVWLVALGWPSNRNAHFILFVAATSILFLLAGFLPVQLGEATRIMLVLATGIVSLFPERFGVGSLTLAEHELDTRINKILRMRSGDGESRANAADEARTLIESHPAVDVRWLAMLRMLRRSLSRRVDGQIAKFTSPTPLKALETSAARYLSDLRTGRTLAFHGRVGPTDEDVALRTYLDDFRLAVPSQAMTSELVELGPWTEASKGIISELAVLPIADREVEEVRVALLALLRQEWEIWTGDHSDSAKAAYEARGVELITRWRQLESRFQGQAPRSKSSSSDPSPLHRPRPGATS
jgi:hypothetical protein